MDGKFPGDLPVSLPCELVGHPLDHRSNLDMASAILACAVIIYLVGALIGRIAMFVAERASA